jgi:hypothetical protein
MQASEQALRSVVEDGGPEEKMGQGDNSAKVSDVIFVCLCLFGVACIAHWNSSSPTMQSLG